MQKTSIWSRMGLWFKRSNRMDGFDGGEAAYLSSPGPEPDFIDEPGLKTLSEPIPESETKPTLETEEHQASKPDQDDQPIPVPIPEQILAEETSPLSRFRLTRNTPNLERLEEDYERIVGLVDNIQAHLSAQEQRGESMVQSLERMAICLSDLPGLTRQQLDILTQLQEIAVTQSGSMKRLEGELMQLPRIADAQRETLVSIDHRLEESRKTDERVAASMEAFHGSVSLLSETSRATAHKMEQMREDATSREERLAKLLEEQTDRLTQFAFCAIALALIAIVVGLIAVFR